MKPKILFYSDCPFFAGCEGMLAVLFNSKTIREDFDVHFLHRANTEYEAGFKAAVPEPPAVTALALPDIDQLYADLRKLPRLYRGAAVLLAKALLVKNIFVVIDFFRIKEKIAELKPDLMFVNNGGHPGAYSAIAAVLAGKSAGVGGIVYFVNNIAVGYGSFSRLPDYFLDRKLARAADIYAAGSRFSAERIAAVLGLPDSKVRNLYNGMPVREPDLAAETVKKNFKIPAGRPVLLTGGLLEERKGHLFLLKALKRLKGTLPPASMPFCLLAGTGSLRGELEKFINENGLSGDAVLAGFDPNFYNLLNACDIYVQPSIGGEDLPNVISMAMAGAKPVIGTRIAGIPEQIEDGKTGFLVDAGDPAALAEKILGLVKDPEKAVSMGRAGKARFDALFTAEAAVNAYAGLFKELLR